MFNFLYENEQIYINLHSKFKDHISVMKEIWKSTGHASLSENH
jgi:hypothetical protein